MKDDVILAAVINWNGWRDTVHCLDSLLALSGPPFQLLICDNGSSDDSLAHLEAWAVRAIGPARASPRVREGQGHVATFVRDDAGAHSAVLAVHVMRLESNLGYAGAINRCIAWGREAFAPDSYWLLNNDVSLEPGALAHLVAAVRSTPGVGLCGSVLLDWEAPSRVQAIGGVFHRWLAVGSHLTRLPAGTAPEQRLYFDIDYPVGASMLVSREFVEAVGLMDEQYFLYYEEVDWAVRGRAAGFRPAVALLSRIRHKEGASTGSMGGVRSKSMLSEYYGVVNRLRFTRKFSSWLLPVVWLSLSLVVLDRACHREWRRALLVLRLMLAPGTVPRP